MAFFFFNERQSRPFVAVSKFNCKIGVRRKEREIEENKAAYMFSRLFCSALIVHNRQAKPWLCTAVAAAGLCLLGFKGYLTCSACGLSSSHFLDRYFHLLSFWLGPSSSISVCMLSRVRRFMRTSQKTLLHGVHSPAKSWVFQTRQIGKQSGRRWYSKSENARTGWRNQSITLCEGILLWHLHSFFRLFPSYPLYRCLTRALAIQGEKHSSTTLVDW